MVSQPRSRGGRDRVSPPKGLEWVGMSRVRALALRRIVPALLLVAVLSAAPAAGAQSPATTGAGRTRPSSCPLIFVHGGAGSGAQFESQKMRFAGNGYPLSYVQVLEYDSTFSVESLADVQAKLDALVAEVKQDTGRAQVDVLGHSLGTFVMQSYLNSSAERAANVAHYVNIDGRTATSPPGRRADAGAVGGQGIARPDDRGGDQRHDPEPDPRGVGDVGGVLRRDLQVLHGSSPEDDRRRPRPGLDLRCRAGGELPPEHRCRPGRRADDLEGQAEDRREGPQAPGRNPQPRQRWVLGTGPGQVGQALRVRPAARRADPSLLLRAVSPQRPPGASADAGAGNRARRAPVEERQAPQPDLHQEQGVLGRSGPGERHRRGQRHQRHQRRGQPDHQEDDRDVRLRPGRGRRQ